MTRPPDSVSTIDMYRTTTLMGICGDNLNSLPTELIDKIFRLTIDLDTNRKDITRLILVCRQWREYVESSTLLWTNISSLDGPIHVRRALEKSKGALIDLHCDGGSTSEMDLKALLDEAAPHIARWHSLRGGVMWPQSLESALAPLTTALAPCLESLDLSLCESVSIPQNAITLFGGAPAPSTLNEIYLFRIPLAFEPLRLSSLVSLRLRQVESISTPQLLEILRLSPRLEGVDLIENPRLVAIGFQPSTVQPIELPSLFSLSFEGMDHGGTNSIISNIRIPNRHILYILRGIYGVDAWSALFTPSIGHILHTNIGIPTAYPPSPIIRVEIDKEEGCSIRFRGLVLDLWMDGEDSVLRTLCWMVDGLGSEAAECPVHLILDSSLMDPVRLAAIPSPLTVKHLSISDYYRTWERHCTAMVRPPDATTFEWLFPRVESLSIELCSTGSQTQLISMLRSRYGEAPPGIETASRCPMALRSVELRSRHKAEGLVEEIKEIIGEVNVFWTDEETYLVE